MNNSNQFQPDYSGNSHQFYYNPSQFQQNYQFGVPHDHNPPNPIYAYPPQDFQPHWPQFQHQNSEIPPQQMNFSQQNSENSSKNSKNSGKNFEWMNKKRGGKSADKKATTFTNFQKIELEKEFLQHPYLNPQRKVEISKSLELSENQVKTWFQNRRMKEKKYQKITEKSIISSSGSETSRNSSSSPEGGHQGGNFRFY